MNQRYRKPALLGLLLLMFIFWALRLHAAEQETAVPTHSIAHYTISVVLDEKGKQLHGREKVVFHHPGQQPLQEVYFHAYPNAFASKKTTFMRESGGKLRSAEVKNDQLGSMRIDTIQLPDGEALTSSIAYVQPDDGNLDDRTLFKLTLPEPLQPHESLTLYVDFQVQLPYAFARMGHVGDFIMAGQWFPKLAAYETRNTRGRATEGWNLHQYHGNSEFYANYGTYSVEINVPASYQVAATGTPLEEKIAAGRKSIRFQAHAVHDFAWAASPDFILAEEEVKIAAQPILLKLYLDPRHAHLKDRYLAAAKASLALYSDWIGAYPYRQLSIVVPPPGGEGASGMEYPTMITAWDAADQTPGYELEKVVVHEIGHQYFYGLLGSNEFEEAWLDEGFTSYIEDRVMKEAYGITAHIGLESSYMTSPASLRQNAWAYNSHSEYADNVYIHGKLVLQEIERQIGAKQMTEVLRTYFDRWRFAHPSTDDFRQVLEEVSGRSWQPFFSTFVEKGQMTDYAISSIQSERVRHQGQVVYRHTFEIRQNGAPYPGKLPVRIHFKDGSTINSAIEVLQSEQTIALMHPAKIDWVALDPTYIMPLEHLRINNFRRAEVKQHEQIRWSLGAIAIFELLNKILGW